MTTDGDTAAHEHRVVSRDGTRIGFLTRGHGPGLVLVQGAMATAHQFRELAAILAADFTVHTPDRRGRGRSPRVHDGRHDIAHEVEDLDAVLSSTGAGSVFGLSSGAVIALEAARTLSRVAAVAAYEPPLRADGGFDHDGARRLFADLDRERWAAALVSALLTSGTAPAPLRALPRPLARLLARSVLAVDARWPGEETALRDLLPGIRYDVDVVGGMDGRRHMLAAVEKPVLLLSGTRSPSFLQRAARELTGLLPDAHHVELAGLGHSGPWNARRGGRPALVAAALRPFLLAVGSPGPPASDGP